MASELIQFGFQAWNEDYQWWAPNSIYFTFDQAHCGIKELPATHDTQWFDITGAIDNRNDAFSYPAVKRDFLYNYPGVVYTPLSALAGKKYIYPIMIRSTDYFKSQNSRGFDHIDPAVLDDVKNNRARIVLIFPLEGTSGDTYFKEDYAILDSWCKKCGLAKHQVYYIHGNLKGADFCANMSFTYIPIDNFYCWVPELFDTPVLFQPSDSRDLYLSYNRRPRPHRTLLLCELIQYCLLDRGLVSYHGNAVKDSVERVQLNRRPELKREARILDSLIPMEIDMDLGTNNPAWNIVQEHYQRTFLSLVPETLYDNDVIFFSEKTWKTIAVGHPFMLVSSRGMLKKLRDEGYYTFGSFWDESYDNIPGLGDRIRHIVLELERLSRLSREELISMRTKMEPIVKHNQALFNARYQDRCAHPDYQLYRIVENIWNSF
jgi:hypothetical protein